MAKAFNLLRDEIAKKETLKKRPYIKVNASYQLAASPGKALLINQIDFDVDLLTEEKEFLGRLKSIVEIGLFKASPPG